MAYSIKPLLLLKMKKKINHNGNSGILHFSSTISAGTTVCLFICFEIDFKYSALWLLVLSNKGG